MLFFNKTIRIIKNEGLSGIIKRITAVITSRSHKARRRLLSLLRANKKGFFNNYVNFKLDWKITRAAQEKIRSNNLRSLCELDIKQIKKSDRIFILGSGASVNDLTDQDWEYIKSCNSIGFNSWVAHPFVPDIYFIEPPIVSMKIWKDWTNLYELKKEPYAEVPIVVNYKEWQHHLAQFPFSDLPEEMQTNLYYYAPFDLRFNHPKWISMVLWYWRWFKIRKKSMDDLIHQRATLATLIMFSLFAGFKEIVLVGVDLNNTAYFFEAEGKGYTNKPVNVQTGTIHRTADITLDINAVSVPIDEYIYLMDSILIKPKGVKLFIASEKSRLFPKLEKFHFPGINGTVNEKL